jgi:hypothetical protein
MGGEQSAAWPGIARRRAWRSSPVLSQVTDPKERKRRFDVRSGRLPHRGKSFLLLRAASLKSAAQKYHYNSLIEKYRVN